MYTWTQVEGLLFYTQCSLHAENYSGTAGRMSSLAHSGTQFSTKDRDNDRCTCRCAQLASGGMLARQRPRLKPDLVKHSSNPINVIIFPLRQFKVSALRLDAAIHELELNSSRFPSTVGCVSSAGWWFEACGPSNLNGVFYPSSTSAVRYSGIKWYYWKGPNLMATMTTMMVRPANFKRPDVR